jgi:hypothetical protein
MPSPKPNREFPSPLCGFYTTSNFYCSTTDKGPDASRSDRFDPGLFNLLSALCESLYPGFPILPPNWGELSSKQQLETIDADIKIWIRSLPTEVTIQLLRLFQQYSGDRIIGRLWTNYYMNMCHIVVLKIWRILPTQIRTQEKLDSIRDESYALSSKDSANTRYAWSGFPNQMLRELNIGNSPSLDNLGAWSHQTIKQALNSSLRRGEVPFAGLSPLGVIKKTSYERIEKALRSIGLSRIVFDTVEKKYPNPEQEGRRRGIIQEIRDYLKISIEEQYMRCQLLARTFKAYDVPNNQLVESSFVVIGDFHQKRLVEFYRDKLEKLRPKKSDSEIEILLQQQVPAKIGSQAIEMLLKSIGIMVRQDAYQFRDPTSTQVIIGSNVDGDLILDDVLTNLESLPPIEVVYTESLSEKFPLLYQQIGAFCQLLPASSNSLSHQQVLWLYYGLDLNQTEISSFLNIHFGLCHSNPGGVALRLRQARTNLIVSIRREMKISDLLDTDAIELIKEVLEECFLDVRYQLLESIAHQLRIEPPAELVPADRHTFIDLVTIEFERNIQRNLRDDVSQMGIERMMTNFLKPVT